MSLVNLPTGLDTTEEPGVRGEEKKMRGGSFFFFILSISAIMNVATSSMLVLFFPSEQTKFLAQSLQSPDELKEE